MLSSRGRLRALSGQWGVWIVDRLAAGLHVPEHRLRIERCMFPKVLSNQSVLIENLLSARKGKAR